MDDDDTDVKLAVLSSLLSPPLPSYSVQLNALVDSDGDVDRALRILQTPLSRKRTTYPSSSLEDWLKPKHPPEPSQNFKRARLDRDERKQVAQVHADAEDSDDLGEIEVASTSRKPGSSSGNPPVNILSILRAPPSKSSTLSPRRPPLLLSNPAMVAQHTPCTLHHTVLPPELACDLFYTMLDAARDWTRNKWWLFDRLVESPHRTSFFARLNNGIDGDETWQEAAQYWYNGRKTEPPQSFPDEMEKACRYIEKVVNEELDKRDRYPLEWGGLGPEGQKWRANVAAANCYEGGKESVGFHSDQLTYLGPYPTIASLSLGTSRIFRLREVIPTCETGKRNARTYNIPVTHNSLTIMHASTQERFKHCVPAQSPIDTFRPPFPRRVPGINSQVTKIEASNCRINITFRFYRPDYGPGSIPRCRCDVPAVLKPDMKNRMEGTGEGMRYWWMCYGGAQNEGKGCDFWKVMDAQGEGRGPFMTK